MTSTAPQHIAVVGSGPSGCFLAQALHKTWPEARVDVIDRSAAPYGLIRDGVAADHQHTKNIVRQFERTFGEENVAFRGNVEIGTDVSLEDLRAAYDVVALAVGRPVDRALQLPGADLAGVHTAGEVIRPLNSVHHRAADLPAIGEQVVIVGGGNVSLDVARFLAKTAEQYTGSDVNDDAMAAYTKSPAREVTVLSRSGIAEAKSDPLMLKEFGDIDGVKVEVAHDAETDPLLPELGKRHQVLAALVEREVPEPRVVVRFAFGVSPIGFEGEDAVTGVALDQELGGMPQLLPAQTVVSAIGFEADHEDPALTGFTAEQLLPAEEARMDDGLYRTGWFKRGPQGTIPVNRACAIGVGKEIAGDVESGALTPKPDAGGWETLPQAARAKAVDFAGWKRIDRAETEAAADGRVRRKFPDRASMLAVLGTAGD